MSTCHPHMGTPPLLARGRGVSTECRWISDSGKSESFERAGVCVVLEPQAVRIASRGSDGVPDDLEERGSDVHANEGLDLPLFRFGEHDLEAHAVALGRGLEQGYADQFQ